MKSPTIIKVRDGKIVTPKPRQVVQIPKSAFVRRFIFVLLRAIERDARLFVKFRNRGQLTPQLETLIEDFYREVFSVIKSFPPTGNRIPKSFKRQIQQLEIVNKQFFNNYQSELLGIDTQRKRVGFVMGWLTNDVQNFISNFNATYTSIATEFNELGEILPPAWKRIPNRKSDQNRKKKFKEFIENWKANEGAPDKYPKHKAVQHFMNGAGFEFPERTYRLYKLQLKSGTFDNFIQ